MRTAGAAAPALIDERLPRQESAIPLDSALVPEVTGGPVLDDAGRLVGMAVSRRRPAGAWSCPGPHPRAGSTALTPGPRSVYVGWRDQYRCVGDQDAYARALHPAYRPVDASAQRARARDAAARHGGLDG